MITPAQKRPRQDVPEFAEVTAADRLLELTKLEIGGFSKDAVRAAARALEDQSNPLRLVFFSVAVRILLEHIMGTLSPDNEVESCSWYKWEPEREEPVRAQRIQHWLQGGLTDRYLSDELGFDPRPIRSRILRSFNRLSKHVHARQGTLIADLNLQDQEVEPVVTDLCDLFAAYFEYRAALIDPLVDSLDEEAVNDLLLETLQELDNCDAPRPRRGLHRLQRGHRNNRRVGMISSIRGGNRQSEVGVEF